MTFKQGISHQQEPLRDYLIKGPPELSPSVRMCFNAFKVDGWFKMLQYLCCVCTPEKGSVAPRRVQ